MKTPTLPPRSRILGVAGLVGLLLVVPAISAAALSEVSSARPVPRTDALSHWTRHRNQFLRLGRVFRRNVV